MIEGSVDMVLSVGIITLGGFCALIMWQDFVQMVLLVNICSKWTRVLLVSLFHQWKYPEFFFSLLHSPRFELPASDVGQKDTKKLIVICHFCGDTKHKAMYCDKVSNDVKDQMNAEEIAVSILLFCCFFFVLFLFLFVSYKYPILITFLWSCFTLRILLTFTSQILFLWSGMKYWALFSSFHVTFYVIIFSKIHYQF